jgi:GH15 family glucan-1,4-alpha-glucosidase
MPLPLEDYALVGDTQSAALIGRDGSVDWMCVPRFDSGACFAALLGTREHGRWALRPKSPIERVRRRYRPETLILETEIDTAEGTVRLVDFMPPRDRVPNLIRRVEGIRGRVCMTFELLIRFDYGQIVPWIVPNRETVHIVGGPDSAWLHCDAPVSVNGNLVVGQFNVEPGDQRSFVLTWHPSHESAPPPLDPTSALTDSEHWWHDWSRQCTYEGPWRDIVLHSLIILKALTFAPTGGIVAAPTTSLPEQLGGIRNWDYRYCWLRDATFTLYALMLGGFRREAGEWRDWLLRAVAGDPSQLQTMYGCAGERRLTELVLPWLPGYEGSAPVRIGNAAVEQLQLDVYGEVMDAMHQARRARIGPPDAAWELQQALLRFLENNWNVPDEGIWEVRGPSRHFTHSRVMTWVAFDRAIRDVEQFQLPGPVDHWRQVRSKIFAEIIQCGFDSQRGTFTQYYGSRELDASLLMLPLVGFLPATDPRILGTVAAIERELCMDGFVRRYPTEEGIDGLPPGEGAFLACTFWLADNYALQGKHEKARDLFRRLLALRNDVGLLSEEYDPARQRLVGNFPQAFSHVALVNTAFNLSPRRGPANMRNQS